MITSVADERVEGVHTTDDKLVVTLADGRVIATPLAWYPRLLHATEDQRNDWRLVGAGYGIHWPQIDEDLSVEGMLNAIPAPGALLESSPAKELRDRYVSLAKEFYGDALGQAKGQLESSRSELESLLERLPEEQEEARSQIQELVDSYDSIVNSLDEATQNQGVEDTVSDAIQQAQETAEGAAEQAQETAGQATQQAQDTAEGVAEQAQDTAEGAVEQAQDAVGQATEQVGQVAENLPGGQQQGQGQQEQGEEGQEQQPEVTQAAAQKAEELGVDLSQIEGSGAEGRITVKDVRGAAQT